MSTNEELVEKIQGGESDCMVVLWDQVAGLVRWRAWRVVTAINESGVSVGIEYDDLCQCGYETLADAVAGYTPGSCAFSTFFVSRLKTAFATATGYRTKRQAQDPIRWAVSLDLPVGENEETSFSEVIPDPAAEGAISAVAERELREQRREAVRAAVAGLPAQERAVLDLRYFQDMSVSDAATTLGISEKDARRLESNALRYLRHPDRSRILREFWG